MPRELNTAERDILGRIGVDPDVVSGNVMDFYNRIGGMESDNNEQVANTESSAKGVYQFLNENRGKDGKGGTSFETGLNRAEKAYERAGEKAPQWINDARHSGDPRTLTREQADTLLLSDLYYRKGDTSTPMREYFINGQKSAQSLADLYGEQHHTDTDQNDNVKNRMIKHLGASN